MVMLQDSINGSLDKGGCVRAPQTGDRVPAFGAEIALAACTATIFGALVITDGDIVESTGSSLRGLVEEGIQETQRLAGGFDGVVVEDTNNAGKFGRRARSTTHRLNTTLIDQHSRANGSYIRIATIGGVVVSGRMQSHTGFQICCYGCLLVGRLRSIVGEATATGKVSHIEGHSHLSAATDTVNTRRGTPTQRLRGILQAAHRVGDLGCTNGSDVRRSGGIVRLQVGQSAVWVSATIGTRIARRNQDGNTTQTDLLELGIYTLDVAS